MGHKCRQGCKTGIGINLFNCKSGGSCSCKKDKCGDRKDICYRGTEIGCLNIRPGDRYDEILNKIGNFICEKGFDAQGVDHTRFMGSTGDPVNEPGQPGETDTYIVWGDEEETINLGSFIVRNGIDGVDGEAGELIEGTYSEIYNIAIAGELEAGSFYKMTDFQTIYDQPDYSNATTPKTTVETKTAAVDPIILLAISETEFAKEVWRPSTPKHTLEYDIKFSQTEVMGAPAKGRITYCKDEFNNETHYDHTVVRLKRYESVSGSGIFNSFWDTGFTSTEVLTFGVGSLSNKIGDNYYKLAGGFAVSNNVLGEGSVGNIIGIRSDNNTFGDFTGNNTFGNGTSNNIFGDFTGINTFGNGTSNNIFGDYTQNNTFGNYTDHNTFGNNTQNNTFGNSTNNNTFGDNTNSNTFGNNLPSINFTITPTPTHIYGNYSCNIFKRQDGTVRLSYYDNTDALVVVDPTE